ncbi:DUF6571 family protein [Streptomyces monticola]|uniref:DUF6571 family protein n=1 Tax=Streptomyces monticola TaxID=2666263 RepID=A0ABW2JBB5_9ACTN
MVSFAYLNEADLSKLETAAKSWGKLRSKYEGLAIEFDRGVHDVLQGNWEGEAASAAFRTMKAATREYQGAADESKRISNLLTDAHTEFSTYQKQLHELVREARKDSYKISDKGRVEDVDSRWDSPTATAAPGFAEERKQGLDSVVNRLEKILMQATAADEACNAALIRDANGADDDRFNGKRTYEKLDAIEADKASHLMKKKGRLTDGEFMELNRLLEANRNDPEFSRRFAVRTGAENTLEKYNEMMNPPPGTQLSKAELAELKEFRKNLGTTIGTATRSDDKADSPDRGITKFQNDLRDMEQRDFNANPSDSAYGLNGFQVTSSLMSEGKWDKGFLQDYGHDLIKAEKQGTSGFQNPDAFWSANGNRTPGMANMGVLDPMTGFMDALGHNPEASTEFLGSETEVGDEKVDHLDYLMEDRHWPEGAAYTGDSDNPKGYNNLGHALESATTGHPYDTPAHGNLPAHNDAQTDIMRRVVEGVSKDDGLAHGGMQDSLGQMTAEYMSDFNRAVANDQSDDMKSLYPVAGSELGLSEQDATRFMMTVGKDPDGYAAINLGQTAYASNLMDYHLQHPDKYGPSTEEAINNIAHNSGEVQGAIGVGRRESNIGDAVEADKAYNESMSRGGSFAAGIVGAGIGVGASFIASPAVGAGVGGVATTITGDLINQIVSGNEQDTKGDAVYSAGKDWEHVKHSTAAVTQDAFQRAAEANGLQNTGDYNSRIADKTTAGIVEAESNLKGYAQDKESE